MSSRRRPWLTPSTPITCARLHAVVPAQVCALRQARNATGRTQDTWRGQAGTFPSCSEDCPEGRLVRLGLPGGEGVRWLGRGPGGRFDAGRGAAREQLAARSRLARAGLLAEVPTCDGQPEGVRQMQSALG